MLTKNFIKLIEFDLNLCRLLKLMIQITIFLDKHKHNELKY